MKDREDASALDELVKIAKAASALILRKYAGDIDVEYKVGDDPVTDADREANALICSALERSFPGVPIVAEESDPSTFDARQDARECFFVDPLDGTREYVARNGEFAVMIGFAAAGRASLGVVAAPVSGRIQAGGPNVPSFEIARDGSRRLLTPSRVTRGADARALVSRSRTTPQTLEVLSRLGITRIEKFGSAGLKAAAVACGETEIWLQRDAGGMLWDACGPEAIVVGAGAFYGGARGIAPDYSRGPLALDGVLVACTRELFDASIEAMS